MISLEKIYKYVDSMAPFEIQMDFDNSGLLLGEMNTQVSRIMVALDVTMEVAQEAIKKKCQLIVSHHPLIFHPLRSVTPGDPVGAVVLALAKHNIAVISAHTNLDQAPMGVSEALIKRFGIRQSNFLEVLGNINPTGAYARPYGMGRCGQLAEPMAPKDFVAFAKKVLKARGVRAVLGNRPVSKVAVCGGAGSDMLGRVADWGADAFVTADVKYHEFLEAHQRGITLIDGGHFATENPMMEVMWDWLKCAFEDNGVEVFLSKVHKEVYFAP